MTGTSRDRVDKGAWCLGVEQLLYFNGINTTYIHYAII